MDVFYYNILIISTCYFQAHFWPYRHKSVTLLTLSNFMKRLADFFKREWFLLVMIAAIAIIVLLFKVCSWC